MEYKKLDTRAKAPTKERATDAGYDLYALEDVVLPSLVKAVLDWVHRFVLNAFTFIQTSGTLGTNPANYEECNSTFVTKVKTGIALRVPTGHVGLIWDRSGMGFKSIKVFGGVIDSEYRGDVTVCLGNFSFFDYTVKAGDKIAQILIQEVKHSELREVTELDETSRGDKGFGSSGK